MSRGPRLNLAARAATAKKFPADQGWIRMELTMRDKTPHSEEELKRIASVGKPGEYEFGPIVQYGARVKVILREKSRIPTA